MDCVCLVAYYTLFCYFFLSVCGQKSDLCEIRTPLLWSCVLKYFAKYMHSLNFFSNANMDKYKANKHYKKILFNPDNESSNRH